MQLGLGLGLTLGRGLTLTQQAINVLRKYGTDAHVYLPGVGVVNGLTAGNWIDTAATQPGVVDSTSGVGRVNDAIGTVNATQGTTANKPVLRRGAVNRLLWSQEFETAPWAVADGATVTANQAAAPDGSVTADLLSIPTAGVSRISQDLGGTVSSRLPNNITVSVWLRTLSGSGAWPTRVRRGDGTFADTTFAVTDQWQHFSFTVDITPTRTSSVIWWIGNRGVAGGTLPQVYAWGAQLETGSTASPYIPTTSAAASASSGNYWWEFDGTDFLSLGSVPFQQADDHAVIAGARCDSLGADRMLFAQRSSASTQPMAPFFRINSVSQIVATYRNDDSSATAEPAAASTVTAGELFVAATRKSGTSYTVRKNGVSGTPVVLSIGGTTTLNTSTLGASVSTTTGAQWIGSIYPVIAIKGTVTDADLLILERFVAQASGVTL